MARSPQTRPPFERMQRIHERLAAEQPLNCSRMAGELEVTPKTVQRDIAFMRDRWGLPIEWDPQENSYFYDGEVSSLPTVQVTEGEVLALFVARRALSSYEGTPFEQPLRSAFGKLAESLRGQFSISLDELSRSISFVTPRSSVADLETFSAVTEALNRRWTIRFPYRKLNADGPEMRTVQPFHLASIEGQWYLFGHDCDRGAIRTFVLGRILGEVEPGEEFTMPEDFDLREYLLSSFGVFIGTGEYQVVIEFHGSAARLIRERKWHPTQRLRELPGGSVELEMQLGSLEEVSRWVLHWGGQARVVGPSELRALVQQSIRDMRHLYSSGPLELAEMRQDLAEEHQQRLLEYITQLADERNQLELRFEEAG